MYQVLICMNYKIFSYIGLFFALIYRIPQIVKIVKTKRAEDLSSYSYLTHNAVYVNFIVYLVGTGKTQSEWVLCLYYVLGMSQNFLIFGLKHYYRIKNRDHSTENGLPEPDRNLDTIQDTRIPIEES